jgi:hypothetical protein
VFHRNFRLAVGFVFVVTPAVFSSACGSGSSVVSESSQPAKQAAAPANTPSTAPPAAATPAPTGEARSVPSPTPNPIIKQAAAQPGVPVAVPDSVRRPLTREEMEKALQQLPPEVRQRIMGMQRLPTPSPQPTKK